MQDTAGEGKTNSEVTFFNGSLPSHGRAIVGRPAKDYLHQLRADIDCSLDDLPGVMDGERVSGKSVRLDDEEHILL